MFKNKSSLYRIYRPSTFIDVAGHTNVVNILKTELKDNSFTHAFLFAGQRGTGKTSVARIFAKAVNCKNLSDGISCEQCESCLAANDGKSPDIFEIDAASNNGVDEIRNVKSNITTMPILGKYKVYIIDEVHMLTKGAFNALLKTLEEPPAHAIFILATTEYAKIPATIVSRCQTFNFKKIDKKSMQDRLQLIAQKEGFTIDDDTKDELYFLSDGSLRDALNMLEQLMIVNDVNITIDSLKNIFYVASKQEKFNIIKNIVNNKASELINYFESAENQGMDFDVFALSLIEMIKEIIEYKLTDDTRYLNLVNKEDVMSLNVSVETLFLIADNLGEAYAKTKASNANFNYILISILKSINPNISVKTKEPMSDVTLNTEVEITEVVEVVNKPKEIAVDLVEKEQAIEPVIQIENEHKAITTFEELLELQTQVILNYKNSSVKIKVEVNEVINMLLAAIKDKRNEFANKIESWFVHDETGNLLKPIQAQKFVVFKDVKVNAVSDHEILMVCESNSIANSIANQLANAKFRNELFNELGEAYSIFAIDKSKWDLVKQEYGVKKNNNLLPTYVATDPNTYYDEAVAKAINSNPKTKELIDKASALFGDIEVKIDE